MIGSILLSGAPVQAMPSPLQQRIATWPNWTLPGPLTRPGLGDDLIYPDWFSGLWQVQSLDPDDPNASLMHQARFNRDHRNLLVADRAFNTLSLGAIVLGDQLLRVEVDPHTANRQMAQLKGDQRLETSVVGRRQETPDGDSFLADELVLQILHAPGPPRLSRIETLSRYRHCEDDPSEICAEQWQARFQAPGEALRDQAVASHRYKLRFTPLRESAPST